MRIKFINTVIDNQAPIHAALIECRSEALKILLERKVNVLLPINFDTDQILPIHLASAKGNAECWCLLVTHFKKVIVPNDFDNKIISTWLDYVYIETKNTKMTPIYLASSNGNFKMLDSLLNQIPNKNLLNMQTSSGITPLMAAICNGHDLCTSIALSNMADTFIKDLNNNTCYDYASLRNVFHSGILLMNHLNIHENTLSQSEDLLLIRKRWLTLSIVDTTNIHKVSVTTNPTFDDFIKDIQNIRFELKKTGIEIKSRDMFWIKIKSLRLRQKINYNGPNAEGRGVLREYLEFGANLILNSHLFTFQNDKYNYDISLFQNYEDELENMRCVGYFLALVVLNNPLNLPIDDYIFKIITHTPITDEDIFTPEFCNIKNYSTEQIESYQMLMSMSKTFKVKKNNEYIDQTVNINFTDNPDEIVTTDTFKFFCEQLKFNEYTFGGRQKLLEALAQGFYELIPLRFLKVGDGISEKNPKDIIMPFPNLYTSQILSWNIIKKFISNKSTSINIDDWKSCTKYHNCDVNTIQVKWFWEFIKNNNEEQNSKLLKFISGSSTLPVSGFKHFIYDNTYFNIRLSSNLNNIYPQARTCIYELILPQLSNREQFIENFNFVITYCSSGFQFV